MKVAKGDWLAAVVMAVLLPFGVEAGTHTVYPTGVWPDDMNAVQAAVSSDGSVLLKAMNRAGKPTAFNFGAPEDPGPRQVLLEANVDIQGESVRGVRTTIQGGLETLVGVSPFSRRISGIDFVGAQGAAIVIQASAGHLEISNNRIFTVVPLLLDGVGFTEAEGIFIAAEDTGQISGAIRILNNRIDLSDSTAQFRFGLQVDSVDADVDVSGNEVFIAQSPVNGRLVDSEGIAAIHCHAKFDISYNTVHLGLNEAYDGINAFGDADAQYRIVGNVVVNEAPLAIGISLEGRPFNTSGLVKDNIVSLRNSTAGIGLLCMVSGVTVRDNFIVGNGDFGLIISNFFAADLEANDRLIDNDLQHFDAAVAQILLDTNSQNTLIKGRCNDVIDLGVGNQVQCRPGN
jgi:hypothetical protein